MTHNVSEYPTFASQVLISSVSKARENNYELNPKVRVAANVGKPLTVLAAEL